MTEQIFGNANQIPADILVKIAEQLVIAAPELPIFRNLCPPTQGKKVKRHINATLFRLGKQKIKFSHLLRVDLVAVQIPACDKAVVEMMKPDGIVTATCDIVQHLPRHLLRVIL